MMRRRDVVASLAAASVLMRGHAALAQKKGEPPLIAMLIGSNPQISSARFFLAGLRELGYVEGRDYRLAARYAELKPERLPALAAELVALAPAVIFADDVGSAIPARRGTSTIPIVCAMLGDPVEDGLAQSLSHPGGNVTGLSSSAEGLLGKQMEVAARAVSGLREVGVLIDQSFDRARSHRSEAEGAAEKLGLAAVFAEVETPAGLDNAVKQLAARTQALVVPVSPLVVGARKHLITLANNQHLPAVYHLRFFAEEGGFASYGIDAHDNFRRAAVFVDKIIKGARAADLPIEFPTKFELVLNLKTASALGVGVPPALLAQADEVIE